jgi:hypothetical protein
MIVVCHLFAKPALFCRYDGHTDGLGKITLRTLQRAMTGREQVRRQRVPMRRCRSQKRRARENVRRRATRSRSLHEPKRNQGLTGVARSCLFHEIFPETGCGAGLLTAVEKSAAG